MLRTALLPAICFWVLLCLLPTGLYAQSWNWASSALLTNAPGLGGIICSSVVPDGTGGAVVGGSFQGTLTLGPYTLVNAGPYATYDIFVAHLDNAGQWTWAVRGGTAGVAEMLMAMAVSANGDVAVAGTFNGSSTLIGSTALSNSSTTGGNELFVARLNSTGQWTQAVSSNGVSGGFTGMAADAAGNLAVTGYFSTATARFGSHVLTRNVATSYGQNLFVARLSSAGTWTQAAQTSGGDNGTSKGIALEPNGTAVVGGTFLGTSLSFGNFTVTNPNPQGGQEVYVARLSSAGQWTQAVGAGGPGVKLAEAVAVNASGEVVLAGYFNPPSATFGPHTLTSFGTADMFLAHLNSAGQWTQVATNAATGAPVNTFPKGISLDAAGNAIVAGTFAGPAVTFGATTLTTSTLFANGGNLFVAQLTPAGVWARAVSAGSNATVNVRSMAQDNAGRVFVAGQFQGNAVFGPHTLPGGSGETGFVGAVGSLVTSTVRPAASSLTLAPNPARHLVTLRLGKLAAVDAVAVVMDGVGRAVRRVPVPARAATASLDVQGLAPGIYTVRCGQAAGRLVVE